MSKLLIDDYPLMILPKLATAVGLNESIFLQQLHYWLNSSKHERDGRKWVYNTVKQWTLQFPFWSERTVARITTSLTKQGLLIIGNYNRRGGDQTKWYAIDYAAVEKLMQCTTGPPDDPDKGSNAPPKKNGSIRGNGNLPTWQTGLSNADETTSSQTAETMPASQQNSGPKLPDCQHRTCQAEQSNLTSCQVAPDNMAEPLPENNSQTLHKDSVDKTTTTTTAASLSEKAKSINESLLLFASNIDMPKSVMLRCIETYGQDFVLKQTELLRKNLLKNLAQDKKIKNPAGWLIRALKDGYQDCTGKNYAYIADEEKAARRAAAEKRDREIRARYEAQDKAELKAISTVTPDNPFYRFIPRNRSNAAPD